MPRGSRFFSGASLLVLGALLASCSMLQDLATSVTASPETRATGSPLVSQPVASAVPSSHAAPGSSPDASGPIAVPDPLNSTIHQAGDMFDVLGASVEYKGVFAVGPQLVVRFVVVNGALAAGASVLTADGSVLAVPAGSGTLESEPFGHASSPPSADETLTLSIDNRLFVLAVGSIE